MSRQRQHQMLDAMRWVFVSLVSILSVTPADAQSGAGATPEAGVSPRLAVRFPRSGARLSGPVIVLVSVEPNSESMELRYGFVGHPLRGMRGTAGMLTTQGYENGAHTLVVVATYESGSTATASVPVLLDNPPLSASATYFHSPSAAPGRLSSLVARYNDPTTRLRVDYSALDTGYRAGAETIRPSAAGSFEVRYRVSEGNQRAPGIYPVVLQATNARGEIRLTQLDVRLRQRPELELSLSSCRASGSDRDAPVDFVDTPNAPSLPPDAARSGATLEVSQALPPNTSQQIRVRFQPSLAARGPAHLLLYARGFEGHYRCLLPQGSTGATLNLTPPSLDGFETRASALRLQLAVAGERASTGWLGHSIRSLSPRPLIPSVTSSNKTG